MITTIIGFVVELLVGLIDMAGMASIILLEVLLLGQKPEFIPAETWNSTELKLTFTYLAFFFIYRQLSKLDR